MSEPSDQEFSGSSQAGDSSGANLEQGVVGAVAAPPRHVSFSPAVHSPPPPLPPCASGEAAGHQHHHRHHPLPGTAPAAHAGHLHPVSLLERPGYSFVIPCPVARACPVQRAQELEDEEEAAEEQGVTGEGNGTGEGDPYSESEAAADQADAAPSDGCDCEPLRRASPPPFGPDRDCRAARECACAQLAPQHWELLVALLRAQGGDQPVQQPQAPPQLGTAAPGFACKALMPDQSFAEVKLSDYRGHYVVLIFYPADFTFVCPTEIVAFSDRAEEFRRVNCELLICSTDSHFVHLAWTKVPRSEGGLGTIAVPLLADRSQAVSRAYGVLKEDEGLAYRGLFIISDHGVLRQITINDLPVGRSVDETLRLVQAFQFADKHGEVCPANWKPGDRSIKADPQLSKEYFQTVA